MASFTRIPAISPIEFMKIDGLPYEAWAVMSVDGVSTPLDLSTYTAKFVVLSKSGAVVYQSTDVDMDDEGHILHPITPETVADWTLCPERYYLQVFPVSGNPLTLFKGPFNALDV
jgi:hypothetical protein